MDPVVLREMAELTAVDLWVDTPSEKLEIDISEITMALALNMPMLKVSTDDFDRATHWAVKKLVDIINMQPVREWR